MKLRKLGSATKHTFWEIRKMAIGMGSSWDAEEFKVEERKEKEMLIVIVLQRLIRSLGRFKDKLAKFRR